MAMLAVLECSVKPCSLIHCLLLNYIIFFNTAIMLRMLVLFVWALRHMHMLIQFNIVF